MRIRPQVRSQALSFHQYIELGHASVIRRVPIVSAITVIWHTMVSSIGDSDCHYCAYWLTRIFFAGWTHGLIRQNYKIGSQWHGPYGMYSASPLVVVCHTNLGRYQA